MADFLDEKRREIDARLKELKPLVEEYHRLEAASAALSGVPATGGGSASASSAQRKPRAARKSSGSGSGNGRRGRPKGSGNRGNEALQLVKAEPGITIPQIAEKMGIKQNYLYRVLPALEEDGLVTKDGRSWHPRRAARPAGVR